MFNAFISFFTGMNVLTIVTLCVTISCFILWIFFRKLKFLPFIGIFGIVATVLFRLKAGYNNGNEPLWFSFWSVVIVVGIYFIAHYTVLAIVARRRAKAASVGYMHKTKIKLNKKGTPDFNEMMGKTGVCKTDLKPTGKVDFGEKVLDCVASKGYIYAGSDVKVIKIDGPRIVVAKRK